MSAQPPLSPPGPPGTAPYPAGAPGAGYSAGGTVYPDGASGYPAPGQPGYPTGGQPGGAGYPAGGSGYPAPAQPGYPAGGQPGYQAGGQPGYQAGGQPGYPTDGQPGYPAGGQPGYQAGGQPGYQAPGPSGGLPSNNDNKAGFANQGYGVTAPLVTSDMKAAEANMAPGLTPSAPDLVIPGYENMHPENDLPLPPPAYNDVTPEYVPYNTSKTFKMEDDEARDALLEYVAQHCCYGKGAAKKMKFEDMISTSALHYTLETFLETRRTKWAHMPYSGGFVDGPEHGMAPGAWEIAQPCAALFADQTVEVEVPHTASVRSCFNCFGMGFKTCYHCHGRGHTRCTMCHGNGRRHDGSDCSSCRGGERRCNHCHARGQVICPNCVGSGKLKKYIQLTVQFKNHVSSHVVEDTDLPDELIRKVTGEIVFEQSAYYVAPVSGYPDPSIDHKSQEFVTNHGSLPTTNLGRILQQRQKLQCVPVFECHFKFNDDKGRFWVYGLQKEVYTKDYPQTCCCGCSIL